MEYNLPGSIAFTQRKRVRKRNDSKNDVGNVIDRNEEEAKIFMNPMYILICLESEGESATEKPSNDEQDIPPIHVSPPRPGKYAPCY